MLFRINHYPSRQKPDPVRDVFPKLQYYPPIYYSKTSRYVHVNTLRTRHNSHPNKFLPASYHRYRAKPYHETLYNRTVPENDADTYVIVDNLATNRLDIISQEYYGTPLMWWVIAKANQHIMFDPFNIPRGTKLRIPTMSTLYESGGALYAK